MNAFVLSRAQMLAWAGLTAAAFASALIFAPAAVWGWSAILAAALSLGAVIDARHQLLPDRLTLPLLALGLAFAATGGAERTLAHALGAALGYGAFAGLGFAYEKIRGRAGLGLGDAKLFAAAGAWLGWAGLPFTALGASLCALVSLAGQAAAGRSVSSTSQFAFGPYLAAGFWLTWLLQARGSLGFV